MLIKDRKDSGMTGEKVGNDDTSGSGATGWESVAKRADKFDVAAAKKAAAAREKFEAAHAETMEKREKWHESKKETGVFYAENGEVKESRMDDKKAFERYGEATVKEAEARKEFDKLNSIEAQEAEAERMREQAKKEEEDHYYFIRGGDSTTIALLEEMQQNKNDAKSPEAKAKIQEKIDEMYQRIISKGRAIVIAEKQAIERENSKNTKNEQQDIKEEEAEVREEAEKTKTSIEDAAFDYANRINEDTLLDLAIDEAFAIEKLNRKYENSEPGSKERKKLKAELERYGRSFDANSNSSGYDVLANEYSSRESRIAVMRERAQDWKLMELVLDSDGGKKAKSVLKRHRMGHGMFNKMPKSWDDADFTSDEISKIAFYCSPYTSSEEDEE